MKSLKTINLENTSDVESSSYNIRDTARAVIFDENNNIALLKVSKDNFHKLPGGGVDSGESVGEALKRECMEEVGVCIKDVVELGLIQEIKKSSKTIQNSYCFMAQVEGDKGKNHLTDTETERGYTLIWTGLDDAVSRVTSDGFSTIFGQYVYERELTILNAAKDYLHKFN